MPGENRGAYGTFGIVSANLDTMQFFNEYQYDYFINLSGQCYPLKPVAEIKNELASGNSAYIEYFTFPPSPGQTAV